MDILGLVDVPVWLFLIILLVVTLYLHTSKDHGYFKSVGIPGPKPKPFIGNAWDVLKTGMMEYDLGLKKKYGKAVGVFFPGNTPSMFVFDEEMLSEITVKKFHYFTNRVGTKMGVDLLDNNVSVMEDAEWKHTRSIMSPVFTTGKLRKMATEINRCAKQLTSNLASQDDFDAKYVTGNYTMDVIASTAFGLRINSQEEGDNAFVENCKKILNISMKSPLILIRFLSPSLSMFLAKMGFSIFPKDFISFFENVLSQTFKNRNSATNESKNDFVQLMLNAQAGANISDDTEEGGEVDGDTEERRPHEGLSDKVIVSNAFLFFLAGFHTTSNALRMLMYNLTVNPECQERVIEEVESVVGHKDIITYDMASEMTYLDKCVYESLRMYPPAPRSDRIVKENVTICGVPFKKGSIVWIPLYAMGNDPDIWPEPKKFDPERFSPEEKAKRSPFHWLPFGYGPRNCIGMRLALFEIKVAIAEMLREHRLVRCHKTQVPLQFRKDKYLESAAGIWLKLEKRK